MAEKGDARASGHEPFLQLDVGDAAFVGAGVAGSVIPWATACRSSRRALVRPFSGVSPVFARSSSHSGKDIASWSSSMSRPAEQVLGGTEFRAVAEESGQAVVDMRGAAVRVGGDPAGGFARGWRSLAWRPGAGPAWGVRRPSSRAGSGRGSPWPEFLVQDLRAVLSLVPALLQVAEVGVQGGGLAGRTAHHLLPGTGPGDLLTVRRFGPSSRATELWLRPEWVRVCTASNSLRAWRPARVSARAFSTGSSPARNRSR